jgi:cell wall-associated NlpC family hydrolase
MSAARPRAAVVSTAVLDVRRLADHRSELISQLLLGETVRVLGGTRDGLWWRIENDADRYRGWARAWGLRGGSARRVRRWIGLARGRIVAPVVTATARPGSDASVAPLYWNSRVIPGRAQGRWRSVELPSGARGWVPRKALEVGRGTRVRLADRVRGLLGVPYLWGGRTARGIDCSGLTQQLLAEQGVGVPRDAAHQYRAARRLDRREEPRAGDLVFFADRSGRVAHVGLVLGDGYYVQSRGMVRLSSLRDDNILYDNELEGTFIGIRRP